MLVTCNVRTLIFRCLECLLCLQEERDAIRSLDLLYRRVEVSGRAASSLSHN
jgi:hypothetical protein